MLRKKEIKCISPNLDLKHAQTIDKVFTPQTSKQTEVIEGEIDHVVDRIIDIMKSEMKVI